MWRTENILRNLELWQAFPLSTAKAGQLLRLAATARPLRQALSQSFLLLGLMASHIDLQNEV